MTGFAQPTLAWAALGFCAVAGAWLVGSHRTRARWRGAFAADGAWARLGGGVSGWPAVVPGALGAGGAALLLLALARPLGAPIEEERAGEGLNLLCVLDVSSSMRAEDFAPNRMTAAKSALHTFAARLRSERTGLLLFSGTTRFQCPFTEDHETFRLLLERAEAGMLEPDGTAIGEAIHAALARAAKQPKASTVVVLLTDGENTKGRDPIEAALAAKQAGVPIHAIGVGTAGGARIPVSRDVFGRPQYLQHGGRDVVTTLDERLLERIAVETGGSAHVVRSQDELDSAYRAILSHARVRMPGRARVRHQELFAFPAAAAVLLLLGDVLASFLLRRRAWRSVRDTSPIALPLEVAAPLARGLGAGVQRARGIGRAPGLAALVLLSPLLCGFTWRDLWPFHSWRAETNRAADQLQAGSPAAAAESAQRALERAPDSAAAANNLGLARYGEKKYGDAVEAFRRSASLGASAEPLYNLGNALVYDRKLDEARKAYEQAARASPADPDVAHNLKIVRSLLARQTPPPPPRGQPSPSSSPSGRSTPDGAGGGEGSAAQGDGDESDGPPSAAPTPDVGMTAGEVDEMLRRNRDAERRSQAQFQPRPKDKREASQRAREGRSPFELSPQELFRLSPEQLQQMMSGRPPGRDPAESDGKDW